MKTHLKILLSLTFCLFSLGILNRCLEWMNRPSDAWFYAGALGTFTLLAVVPGVLGLIWRDSIASLKRP